MLQLLLFDLLRHDHTRLGFEFRLQPFPGKSCVELLLKLDELELDFLVFIFDRVGRTLLRVLESLVFPSSQVAHHIHFLDFQFESLQFVLKLSVLHLLFLEFGLVTDEVGSHEELSVTQHADVPSRDLAIHSQVCLREIPPLDAAVLALVESAELAENAFTHFKVGHFAGSAILCDLLLYVRPSRRKDRISIVKWQLLMPNSIKIYLWQILIDLFLDTGDFIFKIHRVITIY